MLDHSWKRKMCALRSAPCIPSRPTGEAPPWAVLGPRISRASLPRTFSSLTAPAPSPAWLSRGCSSSTVRKSFSDVWVRKPISAFGWRP